MLFAIIILTMMAFSGLAIDVGHMEWQKRKLQGAADAAAMGALRELELGHSDMTTAGLNDAALNGFTNGGNTTVTINNPPAYGTYSTNNQAVEAIITKTFPTFFMMAVGRNSVVVSARSVGLTTTTSGSIGGCIFALNPTASDALNAESGANLTTSCSIVDESNAGEAFKLGGSDDWQLQFTTHHAQVGVVGGWTINGAAQIVDATTGAHLTPVTITSPGDPLASCVAPTPGTITGGIQSASPASYSKNSWPTGGQISPGIYCGGISVGNTGGNTLNLAPGTYVLAGGGFSLGSQAIVAGAGVAIYSTSTRAEACSWADRVAPTTGRSTSRRAI